MEWMLGAQVGESAILSAAGRHLATRGGPPRPRWCEGSFGTLLLERDIARENLTFGPGGSAPAIEGLGLGITIDDSALQSEPRAHEQQPEPSTTGGRPWAR
jgi:muconate cycloisomerase